VYTHDGAGNAPKSEEGAMKRWVLEIPSSGKLPAYMERFETRLDLMEAHTVTPGSLPYYEEPDGRLVRVRAYGG